MKEQLLQLIEAYAAARPTGNATLQRYAADQLSIFIDAIEITPRIAGAAKPDDDGDD